MLHVVDISVPASADSKRESKTHEHIHKMPASIAKKGSSADKEMHEEEGKNCKVQSMFYNEN